MSEDNIKWGDVEPNFEGVQPCGDNDIVKVTLNDGSTMTSIASIRFWEAGEEDNLISSYQVEIKDEAEEYVNEAEEEAFREIDKRMNVIAQNGNDGTHYDTGINHPKQERYKDGPNDEEDYIDKTFKSMSAEGFRGAMQWTVCKYFDRLGKKDDLIQELMKAHDYLGRWIEKELIRAKGDKE